MSIVNKFASDLQPVNEVFIYFFLKKNNNNNRVYLYKIYLECRHQNSQLGKTVMNYGVKSEDANNGSKSHFKICLLVNRAAGLIELVQINSKEETNTRKLFSTEIQTLLVNKQLNI